TLRKRAPPGALGKKTCTRFKNCVHVFFMGLSSDQDLSADLYRPGVVSMTNFIRFCQRNVPAAAPHQIFRQKMRFLPVQLCEGSQENSLYLVEHSHLLQLIQISDDLRRPAA